jgi:hypothetical protein
MIRKRVNSQLARLAAITKERFLLSCPVGTSFLLPVTPDQRSNGTGCLARSIKFRSQCLDQIGTDLIGPS